MKASLQRQRQARGAGASPASGQTVPDSYTCGACLRLPPARRRLPPCFTAAPLPQQGLAAMLLTSSGRAASRGRQSQGARGGTLLSVSASHLLSFRSLPLNTRCAAQRAVPRAAAPCVVTLAALAARTHRVACRARGSMP